LISPGFGEEFCFKKHSSARAGKLQRHAEGNRSCKPPQKFGFSLFDAAQRFVVKEDCERAAPLKPNLGRLSPFLSDRDIFLASSLSSNIKVIE
jgi:hypothetical protein